MSVPRGSLSDRPPAKWRKYLKLVEFDLTSLERLEKEVTRFPYSEQKRVYGYLMERVDAAERRGLPELHVMKLVPMERYGQLPNLRISTEADLASFAPFLQANSTGGFREIWCCSTPVSPNVLSVAGRVAFEKNAVQTIEQIWHASPRLIEEMRVGVPYSYARAHRPTWGWRYQVTQVHPGVGTGKSEESLQEEFRYCLLRIERERERLERFQAYLEGLGSRSYSFEYKLTAEELYLIDWDTEIDRRILA